MSQRSAGAFKAVMSRALSKIGISLLGLALLCRCSLAFDLDGLDNGRGGADAGAGTGGSAGVGGTGGSDAGAVDGLAGTGGTSAGDAANESSGGTGGTDVRDAASDSPDSTPTPDAASDAGSLTLGLVAHYRFDETSGTTAADATGNNQPATLLGGASFTSGLQNNAVSLAGNGGYVSLPANIVSGYGSFSISVWVRLNTTQTWSRIFDFGTGTTTYMYLTPSSSNFRTRFAITTSGGGAEQQLNATRLFTNTWHHVAVTLSGSTGTLYVDGTQVAQNTNMTLDPANLGSTNHNWLGRSQYTSDPYLDGRIDNLRMYNRVLTTAEVQALEAGNL